MTPLFIPGTRNTPTVHFEPATFRFEVYGTCVPENAAEFFEPVFRWLSANLAYLPPGSIFHFNLSYFNSTSLKALFHVLKQIKEVNVMGGSIGIRWYVEPDDEFMTESVALFTQMLELNVEVVELPNGRSERIAS